MVGVACSWSAAAAAKIHRSPYDLRGNNLGVVEYGLNSPILAVRQMRTAELVPPFAGYHTWKTS